MLRIIRVLVCTTLLAVLLPVGTASAHERLPVNQYKCFKFTAAGEVYTDRDLFVREQKRYAFKNGDGDVLGSPGEFRHPSDTNRIIFTSGYLDNRGWRATHSLTNGFPEVKMKRYVDGDVVASFHCSPQSG